MRLHLPAGALKRPADTDVSDLTTAVPAGAPHWAPGEVDVLVLPFESEPTAAEQAAIERRLTTEGGVEETLHGRVAGAYAELLAFENQATVANADVVRTLKVLCKVARALIRLQRRQFDKAD